MNINNNQSKFCFLCLQRNCDQERLFKAEKFSDHSKHSFNIVLYQEFSQLVNSMYEQINKVIDELLIKLRQFQNTLHIFSQMQKNISQSYIAQQINAHFIFQDYVDDLQKFYDKIVRETNSLDIILSQLEVDKQEQNLLAPFKKKAKPKTLYETNEVPAENLGNCSLQQEIFFDSKEMQVEMLPLKQKIFDSKEVQVQLLLLQENNLDEELQKEIYQFKEIEENLQLQYQSNLPKQRKNDKAIQLYDDIFKCQLDQNETNLLNIILRRGQNLYSQKKFAQAIQMFDFILCFDSKKDSQEAYYYKGLTYSQMDRNQDSLFCYEKALQLDPKNSAYLQAKGYQLFELKKYTDSINCCNEILKSDPKNVKTLNTKGNCLHQINKFEEAIHCYDKAIQINKKYSPTFFNKGIVLRSKNKLKEALENFSYAISLDPTNIKYYQQKQDLEKILEKAEVEKKNAQKAIKNDPKNPDLYRNYGDILFLQKNHSEAIQQYEKALENGYSDGEKLKGIIAKLKQQEQKLN